MKKILCYALLLALGVLVTGSAIAQVPRQISYQGAAMNGSTPATGPHTVLLKLYTASSGGSPVYTESQTVQFTAGIFNMMIGSVTPIPNTLTFDQQYYVGISIDGGAEMTPRSALSATPYALHASVADQLAGGSNSGITTITNSDGTIQINNPNGPTTSLDLANASIPATKLAIGVIPTSLPPSGIAGGDLSGTYPSPSVIKLNSVPVSATLPASGQSLIYNGSNWAPSLQHSIVLFDSGTVNPYRMFVQHSPAYPTWGMRYNDTTDAVEFVAGGVKNASVTLWNGNITGSNLALTGNASVGNKVQRGTDTANMIAIAYAGFNTAGSIVTGTSNVSLVSHTTGVYTIAIAGETFHYSTHVVVATIADGPGFIYATSSGGNVYVATFNTSGVPTDHWFQIVIFKR